MSDPACRAVRDIGEMIDGARIEIQYVDLLTGETFGVKGTGAQPVPDDMPGVVGIFVGGCVEQGVGG